MRSPLDAWIERRTGIPGPDPAALRRWQEEKLLATARRAAARSPFHAERLRDFTARDAKGRASLKSIPHTTARHLREHGDRMLCVSQDDVERVVTLSTSGTTGQPKRLFFTLEELEITMDFFRVGMSTFTRPGERVLILLPGRRPDGAADLLARSLPGIGAEGIPGPWPWEPAQAATLARGENAACLAVTASGLRAILEDASALRLIEGVVRVALLSGEPVPSELRSDAMLAGIEVFDHYGLTETCFGGGVECKAHAGYHLREADLLVEIADPLTGEPVAQGREGEVVVSTLTRQGMPLLRYRTGDVARMLPGPCPCGSPLPRLGPVSGRIERTDDGFQVIRLQKGTANAT